MTKEWIKSLGPNCGFDTLKPSGKKKQNKTKTGVLKEIAITGRKVS